MRSVSSGMLLLLAIGPARSMSLDAQTACRGEPGSRSFNRTEWWTEFPGTEIQFATYWATHPAERDAMVGFWQMHPNSQTSFGRSGSRIAPRVAIMRDCSYAGWEYVAISLYQRGEGSARLAEKRRILFVLRAREEPGVYDIRYPGEPFRAMNEARLDLDDLLILDGRTVESWFRL